MQRGIPAFSRIDDSHFLLHCLGGYVQTNNSLKFSPYNFSPRVTKTIVLFLQLPTREMRRVMLKPLFCCVALEAVGANKIID
jgi:hypothetical protein